MIAATPFFSDRGCHIRIYNEIKYLNKNNVEVVLCTYHLGYNPPGIKAENIKRIMNIPWYKKITPGASWHKLYLDFLLLILSFKEYNKIKPKIIHAHLYEGLLIAWLVKVFTFSRVKIIFDCQGSLAEEMYQYTLHKNKLFKIFYPIFHLIEKILLFLPDKILCSSENSYKFIKEKYKIRDERIDILNDGIDEEMFKKATAEDKKIARQNYGISDDKIVIIYTGSMAKAKGVDELLEALPAILKKNNKLTFVFAGYGELENYYKEKHGEYVKNGNIIFIGRFSYFDLPKILAMADYAIDPKKDSSESSGKLFNYIAVGLPVACFKNDFNFNLLAENGVYIENFLNLNCLPPIDSRNGDVVKTSKLSFDKLICFYEHCNTKRFGIDCRALSIGGGVRTYGINLINELMKQDKINQYFLFYNNKCLLKTFQASNFSEIAINFNVPILYFFWDHFIMSFFCWKYKIDVIHGLKNTAPIFVRAKRVVTINDIIPTLFPKSMKWHHSMYWKINFWINSKLKTFLIFISNSTKDDYRNFYPSKNESKVIYLGIKQNTTPVSTNKENIILYVGSLEPRKNVPNIISAFKIFSDFFSDYYLYLVGKKGWEDPRINDTIEKLKLSEKIIKTGFVEDNIRDDIYKKSKIFIYISRYEGFGLPILEAMGYGLPVITSNNSSLKELGAKCGILVDCDNPAEIARAFIKISSDENLAKQMSVAGIDYSKRFNWINTAKETLNIYENV